MLQLAIPVTLRTIGRVLGLVLVAASGVAVMYLAFGLLGAAVLLAFLLLLGRLLIKTARGR